VTTNLAPQGSTLPSRASFSAADVIVYALLLALCALPFFLYERAPDFINSDVHYVDLADSLLHSHSYSANFTHEGLVPPGLAVILAAVCVTLGCTHDILTRTMPVFLALGLLLSYEVLRRQRGRLVAAVSCLLLAASPNIFPWVTSRLWPIFPYFCVTMIIFLLIPKLEASQRGARTVLLMTLLCLLLTAAVLIESIGLALVVAILAWLALSFFLNPGIARLRLRRFLPIALIGLLAEGLWLHQGGNRLEWPLHGFPEGYLAQLKVKDGNHPELGFATPTDVLLRIEKNLRESTIFLAETLLHRWISPSWTSPLIAGFAILILCGLWSSLWRSSSQLCALYFVFFECVYLLWPWLSGVVRFAVAVLPLACLYLAEGFLALRQWYCQYPRRVASLFLPLSMILAIAAGWQGWVGVAHHGFQEKMSALFWIVCVVLSVRLIWKGSLPSWGRSSWARSFSNKLYTGGGLSLRPTQVFVLVVTTYLVSTGVAAEIPMGRENLVSGSAMFGNAPEIQAARWIQSHTDPNAVIAAGQNALIYHYSKRRVIWFPPISNPSVIMDGIQRHHIEHVVIIKRSFSYYLPPETTCFDLLYSAYPESFRLEESNGPMKIYEVLPNPTVPVPTPVN
jgi:hypothetical protein